MFDDDHPNEECGVIGVFAPNEDVARMAFFGLYALQHRGQEAAGIAVADGQTISMYKGVGLVSHVFTREHDGRVEGTLCNRSHALFDDGLIPTAECTAIYDRDHSWSAGAGA